MTRPVVIVAGALANKPRSGGEAWVRLSWIAAMEQLGADVAFVERLGDGIPGGPERAAGWFEDVTSRFGLSGRSFLLSSAAGRTEPAHDLLVGDPIELRRWLRRADALVDISGNVAGWTPAERIDCRVHVDVDPGYTQVWAAEGALDLAWYHLHATVGTAVASKWCPFPDGGVTWIPVRPPVDLARWSASPPPTHRDAAFTTVTSWRGPYGPLSWAGSTYGVKAHRFRRLAPIVADASAPLELALQIDAADAADAEALRAHGWRIVDPADVAGSPSRYASYLAGSRGEVSVASPVYVEGRTGWFSDRTANYLAAGRPAIVDDTGWSRTDAPLSLPEGLGLHAMRTPSDALAGIDAVLSAPRAASAAAREVAVEHFAPRAALGALVDAMGLPAKVAA